MQPVRFLTATAVAELTSLSRATIDRKVATGDFPKPVKISDRRKAWPAAAVAEWMAAKLETA